MTDHVETANGTDKSNGTNGHAVPVPAASSAAARPSIPVSRPFERERTHAVGQSELDAISTLSTRSGAKLQGTTRVMNAFMGYVTTVCGRAADQLTEADMTILGGMLSSLDKLEVSSRRGLS